MHDASFYIPWKKTPENLERNVNVPVFSYIYKEIFVYEKYSYGKECCIGEGDIVFDCGANIGIFSRYAKYKGASKIYSFEPEKNNYKCLVQNVGEDNSYNTALSNESGSADLHLHSCSDEHSLIDNNINKTFLYLNQKIKVITLNDFIKIKNVGRIDFLKISVEGAEMNLFEGISDEILGRIRKISIEYHHAIYDFDEKIREEFILRLNGLGFKSHISFFGTNNHLQMIYFWKEDNAVK